METLLAILTDFWVLKRFSIESPSHCFWLFSMFQSQPDVHNGSDKLVICPGVISFLHGLCGMDICFIVGSTNNVVKKEPVLGARVSPCGLVFVNLSGNGVCNDICYLYSFLPNGATSEFQVMYGSGFEVTKENDLVLLASISQNTVMVRVELLFDIVVSIKHWGTYTDDDDILVVVEPKTEGCKKFVNAPTWLHKLTDEGC